MHSSRMRTARLLPYLPPYTVPGGRGGLYLVGGEELYLVPGGTCPGGCTCQGMYLPGGCTCLGGMVLGGCTCPGGCTWSQGDVPGPRGVYLPRGCTWSWGCTWSQEVYLVRGGYLPRYSPPVDRQTRVKTQPSQTSFAGGNDGLSLLSILE